MEFNKLSATTLKELFVEQLENMILSGKLAIEAAGGNPDLIIPLFIRQALPPVILYIFSLTLLSAAILISLAA